MVKKDVKYWLNTAITLFLMFGFGYLPPVLGISSLGMKAVGIFLGAIWGWIFVDLVWPSIFIIIAVGTSGYITVGQSFAKAFGDTTAIQLIFIFAFVTFLNKSGFSEYIANWFATRKIGINRPWIFAGLILAAAFILSLMTFAVPAIVVCWSIYYKICNIFHLTRDDKYTRIVLFGIVMSATAGALCLPYQIMSVIYISGVENASDVVVNGLTYSLFRIPTSAGIWILYLILCKIVFRPDVSKLMVGDKLEDLRGVRLSESAKYGLLAFVLLITMLFLPNLFPKLALAKFFNSLGVVGCVGLIMGILLIIRINNNGIQRSILDFTACMGGINWTIVILICSTAPLSAFLESDEAGIFTNLVDIIYPLADTMGTVPFIILISIFMGALTQIAHNLLLARLFLPLLISIAVPLGISPMIIMMSLALPFQFALCTPGASANAAMVWSNAEWITVDSCVKQSILSFILLTLYNSFVVIPLALLLY